MASSCASSASRIRAATLLVGVEVPEAVGVEGDRKLVGDDEVDSDALADPVREEHAGGDTPAEEVEPARTGDVRQRDRVRIGGHVVADDDELAHTRGRPDTHKRPDPSGSMSVTGLCHTSARRRRRATRVRDAAAPSVRTTGTTTPISLHGVRAGQTQ